MHTHTPLCHSTCCLSQSVKADLLCAENDGKVNVHRWRRLPSCSSRQGVCRVTSRPPSPVTSSMMRLTSHKMSLKRPKRYHHVPPPPHKCYSTAAQGQILELSSCLTLLIGGPDMHAIACFLCLHVGSNAVELMPCTYTAVVPLSYTVYSQVAVQVSSALCNYQT